MMPGAASDLLDRVHAIRRAVALLVEHGDDDVRSVAAGIAQWVNREPGDDTAMAADLDLPPCWRTDWRRAERDLRLLDLSARWFPGLSGRAAARKVWEAASRYETTSWPRDRRAGRRPDGMAGDLFDVLRLGELPGFHSLRLLLK